MGDMSRAKSPRRSTGTRSTPAPRTSRPLLRPGPLLLLVVIAAAVAGVWLSRREAVRKTVTSPADTLDARAAFLMGGRLGSAGKHAASIRYFRRAADAGMGDQWEGRFNLAASLINAALEVETRLGR